MIVAVTGGAGFIGRHVVSGIRSSGHERRVVDLSPGGDGESDACDVTDLSALTDAFAGADAVIHLAALADFADVEADPARADAVNAGGTLAVLRAALACGVRRVVYASTSWVYDGLTGHVDEDTAPLERQHLYTATKLTGEGHCRNIDASAMEVVICRLGTAYGPGARPTLVTSRMLALAAEGRPLTINGDGAQGRQLTYVGDLADGLILAVSKGVAGATYNLVGPRMVAVREIADEVAALVGELEVVHTEDRAGEIRLPFVVAERAARDLGWHAKTELRDGLARQLAWQLARSRPAGANSPALVGVFDAPGIGAVVPRETLTITGWAIGSASPVSSVAVSLADGPPLPAGLHRPRPNLAAIAVAGATSSGFEIMVDLRSVPHADGLSVTAVAELLDGSRHVLPALGIAVASEEPTADLARPRPRWSRWVRRRRPDPIRLLIWARALGGGGSQYRMCELTDALAAQGDFHTTIAAPFDGPLRGRLEAAGASVQVVPRVRLHSDDGYRAQIRDAVEWARGRFDMVFAPTITSFPGLDVAAHLALPAVWRIGEIEPLATVASWLGERVHPWVEQRAGHAYGIANRVLFNCRRGLDVRREEGFEGRFHVLGTGVDVVDARAFRAAHDQTTCRQMLHLAAAARHIVCTGSLWPVKGHATLVTAFAQVRARHPDLHLAVIGEHRQPYTAALIDLIEQLGLDGAVRLVPLTHDVRPWLRAADAFALPSESESMPTSALEAMAFHLPILATRVGGVPEIVDDGGTGWLCESRNVRSAVCALDRMATASAAQLRAMGDRAAERATRDHDRTTALATMTGLLRTVAGERPLATW